MTSSSACPASPPPSPVSAGRICWRRPVSVPATLRVAIRYVFVNTYERVERGGGIPSPRASGAPDHGERGRLAGAPKFGDALSGRRQRGRRSVGRRFTATEQSVMHGDDRHDCRHEGRTEPGPGLRSPFCAKGGRTVISPQDVA